MYAPPPGTPAILPQDPPAVLPGAVAALIGVAALGIVSVPVAIAHGANVGDAYTLSLMTRIPRGIWALLWLAGTLLAVVVGGKWLILRS